MTTIKQNRLILFTPFHNRSNAVRTQRKLINASSRLCKYIHDKRKCINNVSPSQETAISEIVLDDDVGDCVKYKLDIVGVGCYGELRVDILCVAATIQSFKLLLNVTTCLLICASTC